MLDANAERAIGQVAEQVREGYGADLVALVLYGSAAGEDFVPGHSDLNFVIVLRRVTFAHLRALHRWLPAWHKLGVATPLVVDRAFLERARDVFPMEFLDIKTQHRVLFGEEVFATLPIDGRNLRFQAEHEARSKLMRLRAIYAEVGTDRGQLETLMQESSKTFVVVMKNVLRLRGGAVPTRYLEILRAFEAALGANFPTLRHVLGVKFGAERWGGSVDAIIETYLDEIERLVDVIDRTIAPAAWPGT